MEALPYLILVLPLIAGMLLDDSLRGRVYSIKSLRVSAASLGKCVLALTALLAFFEFSLLPDKIKLNSAINKFNYGDNAYALGRIEDIRSSTISQKSETQFIMINSLIDLSGSQWDKSIKEIIRDKALIALSEIFISHPDTIYSYSSAVSFYRTLGRVGSEVEVEANRQNLKIFRDLMQAELDGFLEVYEEVGPNRPAHFKPIVDGKMDTRFLGKSYSEQLSDFCIVLANSYAQDNSFVAMTTDLDGRRKDLVTAKGYYQRSKSIMGKKRSLYAIINSAYCSHDLSEIQVTAKASNKHYNDACSEIDSLITLIPNGRSRATRDAIYCAMLILSDINHDFDENRGKKIKDVIYQFNSAKFKHLNSAECYILARSALYISDFDLYDKYIRIAQNDSEIVDEFKLQIVKMRTISERYRKHIR